MDNWYALYTKSRHEKLINSELNKRNIESFLPTRKIKRRWSDRIKTIEEPLFKSYIFVKTELPARKTDILKIKGAVKFVSAGVSPVPIDENVIHALQNLVQHDIAIDPFPYLEKGDRVIIKSGPFKNTEGFIVRKDEKKCRLVISITAIKSSVAVEIDAYLVDRM
jgi:transcription antitermination factor NusG